MDSKITSLVKNGKGNSNLLFTIIFIALIIDTNDEYCEVNIFLGGVKI